MSSLKERKEQFVSDLAGGTTLDIYKVTAISALSYLAWCVVKRKTTLFDSCTFLSVFVDFFLNWNNLLLATTIYANNIPLLVVLNVLPVVLIAVTEKAQPLGVRRIVVNFKTLKTKQYLPFKTYITVYRAQMMIITCICIMAVDFQIFPRRFAKVETWGTSLMDLGVGSFVFSMGLITSRSYLRQFYEGKFNFFKNLTNSIRGALPIFILGFVRLISVKGVDYHEHVTEYGKHWNFFFTLGCMPLLGTLLSPLFIKCSPLIVSFAFIGIYEYLLIEGGLLSYIITAPRDNLISSNREGIFSMFGYFSIFLNGIAIGSAILPVVPTPHNLFKLNHTKEDLAKHYKNPKKWSLSATKSLLIMSIFYQILYYVIDTCYVYSVSRRTANLLYVIWVSAYNCTFLFLFKIIEEVVWGKPEISVVSEDDVEVESDVNAMSHADHVPLSLTAVNNNSLVLFLASNLLTGLINLTCNTIDSTTWVSLVVMILYEGILAGLTIILHYFGIILR